MVELTKSMKYFAFNNRFFFTKLNPCNLQEKGICFKVFPRSITLLMRDTTNKFPKNVKSAGVQNLDESLLRRRIQKIYFYP